MTEIIRFDLEIPPRLTLPFRLDRVLEGEMAVYSPDNGSSTTYQKECDVRLFDDGSITFETTYREQPQNISETVINYVRLRDGTYIDYPATDTQAFSSRIVINADPNLGIVGQALDLRGI